LVDLDGDGRTDLLSGSWPGEIYYFRRQADGTFAAGHQLKGRDGQALNVGSASSAFAVDWDGNGALDLLVGNVLGEISFIPNEGPGKKLAFGPPRRVEAAGEPIKVNGDAAPVAADWDGDGQLDLIVGADNGSVVWFRNAGSPRTPRLEAARTLIGASPTSQRGDDQLKPGDWGQRVKPCVVDWDGDGRPDLLLGDVCGGFQGKPAQTKHEEAEERRANDELPGLRRRWAAAFQEYRRLQDAPEGETAAAGQERARRLDALREVLRRTKDEIVVVQDIQARYKLAYQSHGYVWLFLRGPRPNAAKSPVKGP
jgi:hypothetical protein